MYMFTHGVIERWMEFNESGLVHQAYKHHQSFFERSRIWIGKTIYGIDDKYKDIALDRDGKNLEEYAHKVVHMARKSIAGYLEDSQ